MDPVGPWSAYAASYNRLANAGGFQNSSPSELHHHMGGSVQATPSSSQLLAAHATSGLTGPAPSPFTSTGFLSPPPVGYDSVFTPLFHQKAHYSIQHRPIKQSETDAYNQMASNNYFDQNNGTPIAWSQSSPQLPSPFGILPHESVVPNSPGAPSKSYENFNAHFAAAQTLNQLTDYKNSPFIDPKKRPLSPSKPTPSGSPFYQQMLSPTDPNVNFKQNDYSFKNSQNGHMQQACSISSPPSQGKEYRVPQPPRVQFPQQRNEKPRAFTPKQQNVQKTPLKIYDSDKRTEPESQSSPISFAMIDSQRGFQNTKIRTQQFQQIQSQQTYRFPMTPESDYQRSKSTESFGSSSSNPECNVSLPRRPSPLHPQPSPSQAQSPVYPMYNSPLTTISSPSPVQHESCFNKQQNDIPPPLDVTVSRSNASNSVITRMVDGRYERQDYNRQQWDDRQRRYVGYDTQSNQSRQQYYDPGHQVTLQDLSSCRGDPMSLVKTLQQQQPEKSTEEKPKKSKKSQDKLSDSEYISRVPPPAHHNGNQTNQNSYFEFDRWNLPSAPGKIISTSPVAFNAQSNLGNNFSNNQPQSLMVSPTGPPVSYFPPFQAQQSETSENSEKVEAECDQPKVIVPNIAEELQCLLEDDLANEDSTPKKPLCQNPNTGFMTSFIKFLQGEKELSPPRTVKPVGTILKPKIFQPKDNTSSDVPPVQEFPSDPEDDPRYFPLPKSSDKRNFNSSGSELSDNDISANVTTDKKVETPPPTPLSDKPSPSHEVGKVLQKSSKKKEKKKHKSKKKKKSRSKDSPETVVPRRELSKRKAKEKSFPLLRDDVETESSIPDVADSDSDPAWSPQEASDNDIKHRRSKRFSSKLKFISQSSESTDEDDVPLAERTRKKKVKRKTLCSSKKPSEKTQKKSAPQIIYPSKPSGHTSSKSNSFPYNIGEFVVLKTDTHLRHPPLWRVKEKGMLQKYLHFVKGGMSLYQNIPFYSGLSSESKNKYGGVIVKVVSTIKQDMVVRLLSNDFQIFTDIDRTVIESSLKNTLTYYENFEVYIQTLFSQALDAQFLIEIFQEEDEYFLINVRAIDSVVSDIEKRLTDVLGWPERLVSAIQTYPSYNCQPKGGLLCHCSAPGIQQVILSGLSYDKDTLQPEHPGEQPSSFDAVLCRDCVSIFEALYKLCHFKLCLYAICEEKVNEKRNAEPSKDAPQILNDLLGDDSWLCKLFEVVCKDWGYTEAIIEKFRGNHSSLP